MRDRDLTAKQHQESINCGPLRAQVSDSVSCAACGLPGWAATTFYKIPGVAGRFHNIVCIECSLFGPGRCRWCGEKLGDHGSQRFHSETCRRASATVPFGNGVRVLEYLRRHHPGMLPQLSLPGSCLNCGGPLVGRRTDSRYCSDRCRKRNQRRSVKGNQNAGNSPDIVSTVSTTSRLQKCGVGLNHSPAQSHRYRGRAK